MFYQFIELLATFLEGIIVLSVATALSEKKYKGKRYFILIFVFSVIHTVIISSLNYWQSFSFLTAVVALLYTFAVTKFTSSGKILLRSTATIISWFFMFATDYILGNILIMIIGRSFDISNGISLIMSPGVFRLIFLASDKFLQALFFFSFSKYYSKLKLLNNQHQLILLVLTTAAYIVMEIITGLIMADSILLLQIAVILALTFIVLSLIVTILAVAANSKYQNEKRDKDLMTMSNSLMEKNFKELQSSQNVIRQQVHDFKNHIRTIDGMLSEDTRAKEYIEALLAVSYSQAKLCHSGNEIIDSIINCKLIDAKNEKIRLEYIVTLSAPVRIASIDICAVLANQIDNALEACAKLGETEERYVKIEIRQKETFLFFKVINPAAEDPFNEKHELISTKENAAGLHGFGVKNISETVTRYGGVLKNEYDNGLFTSVAMIPNNT